MKYLRGEQGIYLSGFLRSLGMSLVSIFIPIYIYNLTHSISAPFIFYALTHLFVIIFTIPAGWINHLIGVDLTNLLGSIFRALFLLFLLLAKNNLFFLNTSAVFWALAVSLYWLSFHYSLVGAEEEDGLFGKESSRIQIIYKISAGLGPLAGALIISSLGFSWLYIVALILVIFAGIPPFFDRFNKKGMRINLKKIKNTFFKTGHKRFNLAFFGAGFKDAVLTVFWPIFIYIIVDNYQTVGIIRTASLLVSLILLFWLGREIDKHGFKAIRYGIGINSLIWVIRAFLITPMALFLSDIAYSFGSILLWTPFDAFVYQSSLQKRKLEFFIVREITIHFGGLIGCLLIALMLKLGFGFFYIFSLGSIGLAMILGVKSD